MDVRINDYAGLIYEISVACDKDFSSAQSERLEKAFSNLGWNGSYSLTVRITRTANLPKNIYGYTLSLIEEAIEEQLKKLRAKEEWKPAAEDCASSEEFTLTMKIIGMLCRFENSADLCKRFGEYLENAVLRPNFLELLKKADDFYSKQIESGIKLKHPKTAHLF